jgi:gp16 family phage-associated protein
MIRAPFTQQQLAAAKERVNVNGRSLSQWCVETGHDYQTAGNVLRGHLKATRGEAFRVAAALGLTRRVAKKRISTPAPAESIASQPNA